MCVATATTLWATATPDRRGVESSASMADVDPDAAEWMHSNVTGDVDLLTDGHGAPAGYRHSPIDRPDQDWHDFDYLLTATGTDPPFDASVAAVCSHRSPSRSSRPFRSGASCGPH